MARKKTKSRKKSSYNKRSTRRSYGKRTSFARKKSRSRNGSNRSQTVRIVVEQVPASSMDNTIPAFDESGRMIQSRATKRARF